MRVRSAAVMAGWLLLTLGTSLVQADPISIVQDQRFVISDAFVFNEAGFSVDFAREQHQGADARDAVAEVSFQNTTARSESHLTSTISTSLAQFTGTGTATGVVSGPGGLAQGSSRFEVLFDVTEGRAFDFSAMFDAVGGSWQAHLIESPGDFARQSLRFSFISTLDGSADDVSRRGFLNPGRYEFSIRSDAAADTEFTNRTNGRSTFDFAFGLSPVPEPASLVLFGSGVAGIIARTRRRTHPRVDP